MHLKQRTIKNKITLCGIGVHSGQAATLVLEPLAENKGIVFQRSDLPERNTISTSIDSVKDTKFCTTLSNEYGVTISTVEHLMAALSAFGISNVLIKIDQSEMPIMDGSSSSFVKAIQETGITEQHTERTFIKVLKTVSIEKDNRYIRLAPSDSLSFDFTVDFNHREGLSAQQAQHNFSEESFITDISLARSFGFLQDAEKLYSMGLAQGSSLDNAVIIDNGKVMNQSGLRYQNEMVRHKILDAIGDFYLAGFPLLAHCSGINTGHELNNLVMAKLLSDSSNYDFISFKQETQGIALVASDANNVYLSQSATIC